MQSGRQHHLSAWLVSSPAAAGAGAGLACAALMAYVCAGFHFNPSALLLLGDTRSPFKLEWFPERIVVYRGIAGYDGAGYYVVARDPLMLDPSVAPEFKKTGFLRYQRVGYPLLAWLLGMGRPWAILAAMILINAACVALAAWCAALLLRRRGAPAWWAWAFALSPGLLYAAVYCMTEPLALALAAWALWSYDRGRFRTTLAAFALALLARETVVLFVAALAAYEATQKRWLRAALLLAAGAPAFLYHQWAAWRVGQAGASSAGFAFTWPFLGMWAKLKMTAASPSAVRFARQAPVVLWMLFVLACLAFAARAWWERRGAYALCLAANAAIVLFGYHDWWSTYVNAKRVAAGLPPALLACYIEHPTRAGRALLACAGVFAALMVVKIAADAHAPYFIH